MKDPGPNLYLRGLLLSGLGMVLLSPDALSMRLIHGADTWTISFYRSLFLGCSLSVVLIAFQGGRCVATLRVAGRQGLLIAFFLATANISFVAALVHTTAANTLVIMPMTPLFSALMGRMFIGEGVSRRTVLTIIAAFGGVALIFSYSLGSGSWDGDLFAVLAAFSQAAALVMLRHAGRDDIFPILGLAGFLGAAMVWPFAAPLGVAGADLGILAVVGLVMLPLAFGLFLTGVRWVPAAEVALMALIETVLGPLLVWFVVGEEPSRWALAGGAIVLCAIALNATGALRERKTRLSA